PETLRSFIYTLLGTLNRTFQELKATPEELLGYDIHVEQLYIDWSQPNIISKIRIIIEEIIATVQTKNANADNKMLTNMQNYIYTHYSSDIMLDNMADELGISGKYCSNLFKKLSDDNFKNFLNSYRIDKAKELIEKNPKIKITDLSLLVGFNSSNTFIRVFGKYTGMTPKAYANMLQS
ncbi:MAG: helix-turn-helix domain-containing protein, partial [Hungatella sp.]